MLHRYPGVLSGTELERARTTEREKGELELSINNVHTLLPICVIQAVLVTSIPFALFLYDMTLDELSYEEAVWCPVVLVCITSIVARAARNLVTSNKMYPFLEFLFRSKSATAACTLEEASISPIQKTVFETELVGRDGLHIDVLEVASRTKMNDDRER